MQCFNLIRYGTYLRDQRAPGTGDVVAALQRLECCTLFFTMFNSGINSKIISQFTLILYMDRL